MKDIEKAQIILSGICNRHKITSKKDCLLDIMAALQEIKRLEATEHEVDLQDMQKRNDCRSNNTVSRG